MSLTFMEFVPRSIDTPFIEIEIIEDSFIDLLKTEFVYWLKETHQKPITEIEIKKALLTFHKEEYNNFCIRFPEMAEEFESSWWELHVELSNSITSQNLT